MSDSERLTKLMIDGGIAEDFAADFAGAASAAARGVEWGRKFLRQSFAHETVSFEGSADDARKAVQQAADLIGKPLAEEPDAFLVATRAGWLNLNPAIVLAVVEPKDEGMALQVTASAMEGFINQKTAAGAVRRFVEALGQVG